MPMQGLYHALLIALVVWCLVVFYVYIYMP